MKRSRIYASLQSADREDKCWREQEEDRDPLQGTGKAAEGPDHLHLSLSGLNLEPEEMDLVVPLRPLTQRQDEPQQIPSAF